MDLNLNKNQGVITMLALKIAFIIVFAVFAVVFCALIPTIIIALALYFTIGLSGKMYLGVGVVFYISIFFTLKIFKPEALNYTKTPRTPLFKQTIYILLGMMVVMMVIGENFPHLLPKAPALPQDLTGRILFISLVAFLAPLVEEAFFRGFLFKLLREPYGKWVTIGLTSVLFGLAHGLNPIKFMQTFIMGVCFGLLREESGSLRPSILLHFMNNAIAAAFIILGWIFT
jgi:membrane protease YdiL (CAAX protease family)